MNSPKNKSSGWIKFFPNLSKDNNNSSNLTYIKQLTTIAVSCIAYEMLPPECFTEETCEGITLRILKTMCGYHAARYLSGTLLNAFDALDKGYLHILAVCFYKGREAKIGKLSEIHMFEYTYTNGRVFMNVLNNNNKISRNTNYAFENIRLQTLDLLKQVDRTLMDPRRVILRQPYTLGLRLYYNEARPDDYHAPGFTYEVDDHLDNIALKEHRVGLVQTAFNQLRLLSYLKFRENQEASSSSQSFFTSENPPLLSEHIEELAPVDQAQIECLCGEQNNDNCSDDELLTCQYCNKRQHAACFGVFLDAASVSQHCCTDCRAVDSDRLATDTTLAALQHDERIKLCVFRRALKFCSQVESIDARALSERFHLTSGSASKLMKALYQHRVIPQDPEINSYKAQNIRENDLELALKNFSNTKEDLMINLADQLYREMDEILSQESLKSNSDPIEEVLTPFEKDDLRNTSHPGWIKETPVEMPVAVDPTLNKYRQAFSEEVLEDTLPGVCDLRKEHVKSMPKRAASSDVGKKKNILQLIRKKPKLV